MGCWLLFRRVVSTRYGVPHVGVRVECASSPEQRAKLEADGYHVFLTDPFARDRDVEIVRLLDAFRISAQRLKGE